MSQLADIYETIKDDDSDDAHALALCLSLRLLSNHISEDLDPPQSYPSTSKQMVGCNTRQQLTHMMLKPMITLTDFDIIYQCGLPQQRHRNRAVVGAGILAVLMRESFYTRTIYPGWGGFGPGNDIHVSQVVITIPTIHSTVYHSLVELPLPFTSQTSGDLGISHLTKTAASEYLIDGEWSGIYTKSFDGLPFCNFDPPMENVRFKATQDPAQLSVLEFEALGKDYVGNFSLHGRMNQCTGAILAQKTYHSSHSFEWSCLMTPIGIIGSWGAPPWGGWVWLWKVPGSSSSNMS